MRVHREWEGTAAAEGRGGEEPKEPEKGSVRLLLVVYLCYYYYYSLLLLLYDLLPITYYLFLIGYHLINYYYSVFSLHAALPPHPLHSRTRLSTASPTTLAHCTVLLVLALACVYLPESVLSFLFYGY
jgi:hypothetical protein